MVVKDRNDDDQIVVCVQRDEKYRWDMINGIYMYKQYKQYICFPTRDIIMITSMLQNYLHRKL